MSVEQLIAEFKALSPDERQKVAEAILLDDESWIPESFQQGMDDIARGKIVPLDVALEQAPPSA